MAVYIGVHVHIYVRSMNLMFVITTMVQFTKTSPVKTRAFAVQFLLTVRSLSALFHVVHVRACVMQHSLRDKLHHGIQLY